MLLKSANAFVMATSLVREIHSKQHKMLETRNGCAGDVRRDTDPALHPRYQKAGQGGAWTALLVQQTLWFPIVVVVFLCLDSSSSDDRQSST